jgi:hypothetical protein
MTGVKSPMRTIDIIINFKRRVTQKEEKEQHIQLFNQFEAVESATPLLLIDNGNTSLGKTQAIGPIETPYAAVNVYIPLKNQICVEC